MCFRETLTFLYSYPLSAGFFPSLLKLSLRCFAKCESKFQGFTVHYYSQSLLLADKYTQLYKT